MSYVPDAVDIVWLQFSPQAGHRPALVLTPAAYNRRTGDLIVNFLHIPLKF